MILKIRPGAFLNDHLNDQRVIAIEEHYYDETVVEHYTGIDRSTGGFVRDALFEVGEKRIQSMDDAGSTCRYSLMVPPLPSAWMRPQVFLWLRQPMTGSEVCDAYPDRLMGFAQLPTADPAAAADELSRSVNELGFKGAMIHGLIGDQRLFPDNEMFWPIFARAQELGVPIYLHPANIHPAVATAYLNDYASEYPGLMNAGWGFTMETATIGIRWYCPAFLSDIPTYRLYLATSAKLYRFSCGGSTCAEPARK